MARVSFLNALRFTLKAGSAFPRENWPAFAPAVDELLERLQDAPLDTETAGLVRDRK